MSFDYFYGQQSDLFTFYRVPKVLFTNERFWNISADAKMLYGILLDRMSLSAKNGWIDKNGRVYIIFTIDEAKMALNCAEQKAIKLLSELEKKAGLIERKRQGLGKPNLIYVKNFISAVDVEIDKESIRDFEKLAKKYGVDFAVRKDKSVDPPRFLVFVRSKDADALDAICKEHQARALTKNEKPSVLAQLKKFKEIVAAIPKKVREKKQERDL